MGTSLKTIGNHNIVLCNRTFKDVAEEIKGKLNNIRFVNEGFLKQFALNWNCDDEEALLALKENQPWIYFEEDEFFIKQQKSPASAGLYILHHHLAGWL